MEAEELPTQLEPGSLYVGKERVCQFGFSCQLPFLSYPRCSILTSNESSAFPLLLIIMGSREAPLKTALAVAFFIRVYTNVCHIIFLNEPGPQSREALSQLFEVSGRLPAVRECLGSGRRPGRRVRRVCRARSFQRLTGFVLFPLAVLEAVLPCQADKKSLSLLLLLAHHRPAWQSAIMHTECCNCILDVGTVDCKYVVPGVLVQ